MNTKTIVAIVVVIAVVGLGVFIAKNKNADTGSYVAGTGTEQSGTQEVAQTQENSAQAISLEDALKKGGSYQCTFTMKDPQTESSGTFYIDGKKVRGDFTSKVTAMNTNTSIESHLISDSAYTYTWSSQPNTAFKMPTPKDAPNVTGTIIGQMSMAMNNANATYNCVAWKADASKFMVPTNITFKEMPTMPAAR